MNVMNRKMFANRNARRRLANMGGIMTSSPELMQAAQTYQVGGNVGSPTSSLLKTVELNGVRYKVYTDGRVTPDFGPGIPTQPMDPNNASQANLIEELKVLPDISVSQEMGSTTQDMALQSIMDRAGDLTGREQAAASLEALIATNNMDNLDPQLAGQLLPPPIEEDKSFGQKVGDSLRSLLKPIGDKGKEIGQPIGDKLKEIGEPIGPAMREGYASAYSNPNLLSGIVTEVPEMLNTMLTESDKLPVFPPTEEYTEKVKEETPKLISPELPPQVFPPTDEYTKKITDGDAAAARESGIDQPASVGGDKEASIENLEATANDPNASSDQRSSNVSTKVLTDAGFKDVGNMSTKQRVAAYQEMFKEFLGEGDEDANEEKWHNLAMIGFAIAAGQDPSALANIANGMLEGSKVMKGDRAARRKREDSITSMAIEQVFSEKAAERDAQLRRDIAAAKGGSGFRDPRSPSDAEDLLKDNRYRSILLKQNNVAPENQEAWLDQWSTNKAMTTVQSAYGSQTPEFGGTQTQTTPTATDLPTVSTQQEYDALPPGSEFIQNGQKRKKP